MESSTPNNPNKDFILETETALAGSAATVKFYYHMYGSTMGTLSFDTSSDSGATWTTQWTLSGNQGNVWNQAAVNVDSTTSKFRFFGKTGSSYTSDMAIDSITVKIIASTEAPTPSRSNESSTGSLDSDASWPRDSCPNSSY